MKPHLAMALTLALAAGAPAAAEEAWPVDAEGSACQASRAPTATSDALIVRYDPRAQEITLQTAIENEGAESGTGTLSLWLIFDKGGKVEDFDIAWGYRRFAFERDDGRLDLSTRFLGAKNVDQILADLAASRRLGLVNDGKTVADFDLAGLAPAIAQLKACAGRLGAS